jgi:hypothetical protein
MVRDGRGSALSIMKRKELRIKDKFLDFISLWNDRYKHAYESCIKIGEINCLMVKI